MPTDGSERPKSRNLPSVAQHLTVVLTFTFNTHLRVEQANKLQAVPYTRYLQYQKSLRFASSKTIK
jgi:hypothetical protein